MTIPKPKGRRLDAGHSAVGDGAFGGARNIGTGLPRCQGRHAACRPAAAPRDPAGRTRGRGGLASCADRLFPPALDRRRWIRIPSRVLGTCAAAIFDAVAPQESPRSVVGQDGVGRSPSISAPLIPEPDRRRRVRIGRRRRRRFAAEKKYLSSSHGPARCRHELVRGDPADGRFSCIPMALRDVAQDQGLERRGRHGRRKASCWRTDLRRDLQECCCRPLGAGGLTQPIGVAKQSPEVVLLIPAAGVPADLGIVSGGMMRTRRQRVGVQFPDRPQPPSALRPHQGCPTSRSCTALVVEAPGQPGVEFPDFPVIHLGEIFGIDPTMTHQPAYSRRASMSSRSEGRAIAGSSRSFSAFSCRARHSLSDLGAKMPVGSGAVEPAATHDASICSSGQRRRGEGSRSGRRGPRSAEAVVSQSVDHLPAGAQPVAYPCYSGNLDGMFSGSLASRCSRRVGRAAEGLGRPLPPGRRTRCGAAPQGGRPPRSAPSGRASAALSTALLWSRRSR